MQQAELLHAAQLAKFRFCQKVVVFIKIKINGTPSTMMFPHSKRKFLATASFRAMCPFYGLNPMSCSDGLRTPFSFIIIKLWTFVYL